MESKADTKHNLIVFTGKRHNAVLLPEEDRHASNETIYLLSVPGMLESIREGVKQNLSECTEKVDW